MNFPSPTEKSNGESRTPVPTIEHIEASHNRKGFPKGKTCAEFCVGKIQARCPLGVLTFG